MVSPMHRTQIWSWLWVQWNVIYIVPDGGRPSAGWKYIWVTCPKKSPGLNIHRNFKCQSILSARFWEILKCFLTSVPLFIQSCECWRVVCICVPRVDSSHAPSQWDMSLQNNAVSHLTGCKPRFSPGSVLGSYQLLSPDHLPYVFWE